MEIAVEDGAAGSRVSISSRSNKQNEKSKYLKAAPLWLQLRHWPGNRSAMPRCEECAALLLHHSQGRDRRVGWSGADHAAVVAHCIILRI